MPGDPLGEAATVSLSSSTNEYAIRRKKHLELIKQLRAIGAQADLDLPRITVIGNQSAGKSSLVEAISGINVPRDAGTCTRCPMECRLASSDEPWSCQVYIRWEFDIDGKRKEEVEELPFGPPIKDKADVELALRRAQCAVLNPHESMDKFVRHSAAKLRMVENKLLFSSNTVCLDLSGPDLTDLAFVDLPGIIQNADPETVKMVEDLVMSHIHGNCLILVTIPMSDDIENQKAVRLAKQVDPTGQRTIGVLTKPDTLTVGAVKAKQIWLDVLEGRRFQTTHGYYCTRQPDDDERTRGITTTDAREAEKAFFRSTVPWSTSRDRHRFGTEVLVENLGRILTRIIDETLPNLHNEVTAQLADCSSRLAELPSPAASDPASFVLNLVLEYSTKVRRLVEGDITASSLMQANRRAYARFKVAVRNSTLLFLPYVDAKEDPALEALHLFSSMDDGEKVVHVEDMIAPAPAESGIKRHMYLADVRERVKNAVTRELPDNVPYAVKVSLIQQSQATWEALSRACFMQVQSNFQGKLEDLLEALFSRYGRLKNRMMQLVKDLVKEMERDTLTRIRHILELECVPYTQNSHYLQETKAKYLAQYKDARAGNLVVPTRTDVKCVRVELTGTAREANSGAPAPPGRVLGRLTVIPGAAAAPVLKAPAASTAPSSSLVAGDTNAKDPATPLSVRIVKPLPKRDQKHKEAASANVANRLRGGAAKKDDSSSDDESDSGSNDEGVCNSGKKGNDSSSEDSPPKKRKASATQPSRITPAQPKGDYSSSKDSPAKKRKSSATEPPRIAPAQPEALVESNSSEDGSGDEEDENVGSRLADEARIETENHVLSLLAMIGYRGVSVTDLGRLNPPDMYETELELMAEVRAYTQISYKRVIDNVPMTIDRAFLYGFADTLRDYLIERLALGTPGAAVACATYLAEAPHIVTLRGELKAKQKRLMGIQGELGHFGL